MPKASNVNRAKISDAGHRNLPDPKASHLYTDDNPATTLHGTGFKNRDAALRTLDLIRKRSLLYQFQTVNAMYHRAKHHPAMKRAAEGAASTAGMRAAMEVFREWLDVTYPAEVSQRRADGFKPLLSRKTVQTFLGRIMASPDVSDDAKQFAQLYVDLPKGKRLGNVLVDESKPGEYDWEGKRYDSLNELVPAGMEKAESEWETRGLFAPDGSVTPRHLQLIALAWSPLRESKLAPPR